MLLLWRGTKQPQERIRTGGKTCACHQALACFSNEREDIRQPQSPSGVGSHHVGETRRKDLPRTLQVGAEEAAHMQFQPYSAALPGQVRDCARVARVNLRRAAMTERAFRFFGDGVATTALITVSEMSRSLKWRHVGSGSSIGLAIA